MLAPQAGDTGSNPVRAIRNTDQVVQLVDTRRSERRAHTGLGVRLSPWSLEMRCRRGWRPTGFHTAGVPVRSRGLQLKLILTQVGQCPAKAHNLCRPGATPGPATYGRVRKQEKRPVRETGDFVGSTPTSATMKSRGQTARHQPDMLETMVQLHPGSLSETVCRCFGGHRRGERWSAALVARKTGFNSRTDLCVT